MPLKSVTSNFFLPKIRLKRGTFEVKLIYQKKPKKKSSIAAFPTMKLQQERIVIELIRAYHDVQICKLLKKTMTDFNELRENC